MRKHNRGDLLELARHPAGFTLFERPWWSSPVWRTLKLRRTPAAAGKKNNWNLGWNGERLARNTEAGRLFDDEPQIYAWVVESLNSGSTTRR